jgi:hypothetical protein
MVLVSTNQEDMNESGVIQSKAPPAPQNLPTKLKSSI